MTMTMRKNPEALAIFNRILIAQQRLDSARARMKPDGVSERVALASAELDEACELFEKFVEGIKEARYEKQN